MLDVSNDLILAFQLAPVGLLVSRQRVISHHNAAFADMFGYGANELVGESLARLYPSAHEFEFVGERATEAMRTHGDYSDERIMRDRSGRPFWCHVSGRTSNRETPLAEVVWMFEDLSTRWPITTDLTPREREVAQLLVMGQSSKMIGRELAISPRTVEAHRARLRKKMNASSAGHLVSRLVGRI
jgi:PAS domain S-box-containing protein